MISFCFNHRLISLTLRMPWDAARHGCRGTMRGMGAAGRCAANAASLCKSLHGGCRGHVGRVPRAGRLPRCGGCCDAACAERRVLALCKCFYLARHSRLLSRSLSPLLAPSTLVLLCSLSSLSYILSHSPSAHPSVHHLFFFSF